ncbi:MAG: IS110 family transposase [Myxococcota bacterium]
MADLAHQRGHDVRVVPATLVRSLSVGSRGTKTDRHDDQVLSEVSCRIDLPSVHVPSEVARQRRTICGMREELVCSRTALINCVRGWTRTLLLKVPPATSKAFPSRLRAAALDHARVHRHQPIQTSHSRGARSSAVTASRTLLTNISRFKVPRPRGLRIDRIFQAN